MTNPIPTPLHLPNDSDLLQDDRWALVVRMAASHHFSKAAHLRELLLYLGKRAIISPHEDVTEQEIGSRVLGRRPDYNPQADNIVRVQIRRLRQKLDEYFLTDGQHERLVISIPKGSHVLRFEPRVHPISVEALTAPVPFTSKKWWLLLIAPIAALVAGAFYAGRISGERVPPPAIVRTELSSSPLWSRLFVKDQPTSIVIADSSLVIVQNVLQKSITLNEYIDRSYRERIEAVRNPGMRDVLRMISGRQYTSLADAMLSSELRSMGVQMGAKVAVRYARHMNIRDFNTGNFILIGSTHGVPWVELFEPSLNFRFDRVGNEQRFGFRNIRPITGELPVYASTAPLNSPQESFATISMLPNLTHSGTVLMLNGVTMEATEAAGEFAMSSEFAQVLAKILGTSSTQKLAHFQILLKAASMAGAPHKVDVMAWRKLGN
jgi:hypothetical protein